MENKLIPYQATHAINATAVLIFAPHPDDEVFGCGGTILRHVAQNIDVKVVVVTDGAFGCEGEKKHQIINERELESRQAAVILGYGEPEFWRLADRSLAYGELLIQRIVDKIKLSHADLIYAPSLLEMHPDHRALAMCVTEAVRRLSGQLRLAFYEVGVPLNPNVLLDISDLTELKKAAMECFVSQNIRQRYDLDIAALNRYRTYTLPAEVVAAEAYVLVSAEALINDPLKLYQSEYQRQSALNLAVDNADIPLVSVIIRSMDRDTLSEALDSVALQTYSNIEVVVVAACGSQHSELKPVCGRFPLRLEFASEGKALIRPAAANLGLEKALGQWLIFLDDDDLFDPDHIAGMMACLELNPQVSVVYSGVRVEDEEGQLRTVFNSPYEQNKLLISNFIPIHALLFSRALIDNNGARFDENMVVYEDWDFWLQLSYRTAFLHLNKISAVYRVALGNSGLGLNVDKHLQVIGREFLYDKWRLIWTGKDINQITQYLFSQESTLQDELAKLDTQLAQLKSDLVQRDAHLAQLNVDLGERNEELDTITQALNTSDEYIHQLVNSKSWRLTKPMRWIARVVRGDFVAAMDPVKRSLKMNPTHPVAVILPVYRDIEMTKRCILAAMPGILAVPSARIIAINDASPDIGMQEMLEQLAEQWPTVFVVLKNIKNLGFVGTVNRGFEYFPEHDAVLLNSDVLVPSDWLIRLVDEAYSASNIATVTPFSNNATIASFPYFLHANELPFNLEVDSIDAVFKQGKLPCIAAPTGVGFCMYIRRACLNQIGYLNQEKFGRGYGEENDLCQRALKRGWLNLISPNMFAFHEGGASFSADKNALVDNAMKVIDKLHPNYHADVHNFIKQDALKVSRLLRYVRLLSVSSVPKVLHISHALGGGVKQHIEDLAEYFKQDIAHILLTPQHENNWVNLSIGISEHSDQLAFNVQDEYELMIRFLKVLGVSCVHFHHSIGLDAKLLELPRQLGVRYLLTVHDYYWLNANPTLTDENFRYPGFYSDELHNPLYPLPLGLTVTNWQTQYRPFLAEAAKVIFPTSTTKSFYEMVYALDNVLVVPHIEAELKVNKTPVRIVKKAHYTIGVLGAVGKEKGGDLLEKIAQRAKQLNLSVKFKLIGYAHRALNSVEMTGPYKNKELVALIKQHQIDVILFPAQWPETYSYTLSYALDSALPIIAPNMGAFLERLSGRENTLFFNHLSPVNELVEHIDQFVQNLAQGLSVFAPVYAGDLSDPDFYSRDYISLVSQDIRVSDVDDIELFALISTHLSNTAVHNKMGWRESLMHLLWQLYMKRSMRLMTRLIPQKMRKAIRKSLSSQSIHDIAQG